MFKSLQSQEFMRDPVPLLQQMRRHGSVVRSRIPILGKVWHTTNQAAAVQVLKNSENFTVRNQKGKVVGLYWWMPRYLKLLASNMLAFDDPDHKRLRSLVDKAFHRREILDLSDGTAKIAGELSAKLFAPSPQADLIDGFARSFPLAVICELLGLPTDDRPKFMKWASGLSQVTGLLSFLMIIVRLRPFTRYIEEQVRAAKQNPRTGLIDELVNLQRDGEDISDDELVAMVFLLLLAGHETTTHLISGAILTLFQHPEQKEMLVKDWSLLDLAVEELLRFVSPVQSTKPRFIRKDCEIDGVRLKAGEIVMPLLVASNFDPEVFDKPGVFDITRKPNRHMEFGSGMHFCLGHQLARLELKYAIRTLLSDYPDMELAIPLDEVEWHSRFGLRSLKSLPVRIGN